MFNKTDRQQVPDEGIIKKVVRYAKAVGMSSFFFSIKRGALISFHYENVNIGDAMQMMISGFHNVIEMQLERNPKMSKEERGAYEKLAKDFDALIRSTNDHFLSINKPKKK